MKTIPMNKTLLPLALIITLVLSTPAAAHSPIMRIGGMPGGVLHALLIPEHGLSLLALGLVLGRQQQPIRRSGMLIFFRRHGVRACCRSADRRRDAYLG